MIVKDAVDSLVSKMIRVFKHHPRRYETVFYDVVIRKPDGSLAKFPEPLVFPGDIKEASNLLFMRLRNKHVRIIGKVLAKEIDRDTNSVRKTRKVKIE